MGQCIKFAGQTLPAEDPFKENMTTTGRAEKLIGQMENEFAKVCNSLLLRPLQEIRLYHKINIRPLSEEFFKLQNSLKKEKKLESQLEREDSRNSSVKETGFLKNDISQKVATYKTLHKDLHDRVIHVYETLSKLKNRLPAVIEFQLEMNHYSNSYLEYILLDYKSNSEIKNYIIPLKHLHGEISSEIPDYRNSLEGEVFDSDQHYVSHRIRNASYRSNKETGIPYERNANISQQKSIGSKHDSIISERNIQSKTPLDRPDLNSAPLSERDRSIKGQSDGPDVNSAPLSDKDPKDQLESPDATPLPRKRGFCRGPQPLPLDPAIKTISHEAPIEDVHRKSVHGSNPSLDGIPEQRDSNIEEPPPPTTEKRKRVLCGGSSKAPIENENVIVKNPETVNANHSNSNKIGNNETSAQQKNPNSTSKRFETNKNSGNSYNILQWKKFSETNRQCSDFQEKEFLAKNKEVEIVSERIIVPCENCGSNEVHKDCF